MLLEKGNKGKIGLVLSHVPGYSETFFRNKIKGLQEDGFDVLLFVDHCSKINIDLSCEVYASQNFNGSFMRSSLNTILNLIKAIFITPKKSLRLYHLNKADGLSLKQSLKQIILNQFILAHNLKWLHFGFGMLAHNRENVAEAIGAKMAVSFRGFDLYCVSVKTSGML